MPLGANIKKIRELKKIKVATLVDQTGINAESIYAWERGAYNPNEENLHKLADAMKVSIKDFYDTEGTQAQKPTDNKEKMDTQEEVYRNIVEGNTEYILIPRSVLQEKYRLVALEQFQKDKEQMDKDKAIIDKLLSMNESLVAEIRSMKTQVPELQKAQ